MYQDGILTYVERSLGRGEDQRVGSVHRNIHVEEAQRLTNHAPREVVLHGERCLHHGQRIQQSVGPVAHRNMAEMFPRAAGFVHITARPCRVGDSTLDALRGVTPGPRTHGPRPDRVRRRCPRGHGRPIYGVIGQGDLTGAGKNRIHGLDDGLAEGRHLRRVVPNARQAESDRHIGCRRSCPDDSVDRGLIDAGIADGLGAGLQGERGLRPASRVTGVARGAQADDGDLVLDRVAVGLSARHRPPPPTPDKESHAASPRQDGRRNRFPPRTPIPTVRPTNAGHVARPAQRSPQCAVLCNPPRG